MSERVPNWEVVEYPKSPRVSKISGLTKEEQGAWESLMQFREKFVRIKKQHPNEAELVDDALHQIQMVFATRIARREYPKGWPTYSHSFK